ncbi:MAG TPA: hypothetical protein VH186_00300 [Chloroflexia bacterium]|nr:hypothetical protein [Chloroflexia bacterium]
MGSLPVGHAVKVEFVDGGAIATVLGQLEVAEDQATQHQRVKGTHHAALRDTRAAIQAAALAGSDALDELRVRDGVMVLLEAVGMAKDVEHHFQLGPGEVLHLLVQEEVWNRGVSGLAVAVEGCCLVGHRVTSLQG